MQLQGPPPNVCNFYEAARRSCMYFRKWMQQTIFSFSLGKITYILHFNITWLFIFINRYSVLLHWMFSFVNLIDSISILLTKVFPLWLSTLFPIFTFTPTLNYSFIWFCSPGVNLLCTAVITHWQGVICCSFWGVDITGWGTNCFLIGSFTFFLSLTLGVDLTCTTMQCCSQQTQALLFSDSLRILG